MFEQNYIQFKKKLFKYEHQPGCSRDKLDFARLFVPEIGIGSGLGLTSKVIYLHV